MVGFRLSETLSEHGVVSRGICKESDGYLESVEEWTKIGGTPITGLDAKGEEGSLTGSEIVSMNVWGFPVLFFLCWKRSLQIFFEGWKQEILGLNFIFLPLWMPA